MLTNNVVRLHFCAAQSHVKERLESLDRRSLASPVSKQRPLQSPTVNSISVDVHVPYSVMAPSHPLPRAFNPGWQESLQLQHHKWLSARPHCNACLNTHQDIYRLSSSLDVLLGKEPPLSRKPAHTNLVKIPVTNGRSRLGMKISSKPTKYSTTSMGYHIRCPTYSLTLMAVMAQPPWTHLRRLSLPQKPRCV